jgi:hypothetical protein
MGIIAPSRVARELVTQEVRVIVPPLNARVNDERGRNSDEPYFAAAKKAEAPAIALREVQILVPDAPNLYWGLDRVPEEIGLNRGEYKLPPLVAGQTVTVMLQPHQWIVASAEIGKGILGIIIQYFPPED